MSFLPDAHVFLEFAGAAIILTLIPGPDMALFVGRAISQGKAAGLACIAGCSGRFRLSLMACTTSAFEPVEFFGRRKKAEETQRKTELPYRPCDQFVKSESSSLQFDFFAAIRRCTRPACA